MSDSTENDEREGSPTSLDELTHAELRLLYEEASRNILFAKGQQWKTVGGTLIVFAVVMALVKFVSHAPSFTKVLTGAVITLTTASIAVLTIYQFWQYNELKRLRAIGRKFSSLFREIRGIKSPGEANFHRYLLLVFMCMVVIIGAAIVYMAMKRIF